MGEPYTTGDLIRSLGIGRQRMQDWMERGYIKASIQQASGIGTKSLFSKWDVYCIELFRYLLKRGFPRKQVAFWLRALYSQYSFNRQLEKFNYLAFIARRDGGKLVDTMTEGVPVIIGYRSMAEFHASFPQRDLDDFADLLIINFKAVREEVDVALE